MRDGGTSVLVLSHLYPSASHPYRGIFVARQVQALGERHTLRVVAPTRWVPPLTGAWRAERRAAPTEVDDGTLVVRPRAPQLPFGGTRVETFALVPVVRRTANRLHAERDVEIVHAHFGLPDGYAGARIARELRVPFVLSLWGSDVLVFPRKRSLRRLLASALARADAIIAPSREISDRACELGALPDRVTVIMGGVPDDYRALSRDAARAALGLGEEAHLVVSVGSLVPVKRPLLAIEAIALVRRVVPEVLLVLVGDGPERGRVARAVGDLGLGSTVRLVGAADAATVSRWQAAADVALNTSRSEGLPFALMEALVSGTRVAAVPVGGIPELLDATDGGTLAADTTARDVADAILQELERPRDDGLPERSAFLRLGNVVPRIADVYARALGR